MGEEAKQAEEKKEEKVEEEKKEEKLKAEEEPKPAPPPPPPPPPPPFVLYVDLHCVGCAKKIERSIMKITGVEGVVIDMIKNQVTIKGIVEPQAICNKIMKKTKRKAKVLSPLPQAEGEPMPQLVTSQVSEAITVELNVNMHCEACAEQLKKKILKMRGVQNAVTELSTGKVTVTGTMDGEKIVEYVYRRTRKQARIVPQPVPAEAEPKPEKEEEEKAPAEEAKKEEEKGPAAPAEENAENNQENNNAENEQEITKKEEGESSEISINNEEENMKRMMHYYNYQHQRLYMIEPIPALQLFSDENPNACSIS